MRSRAGSVTVYLDQLKDGDPAAVQRLWERYFHRLIHLAHAKLRTAPRLAGQDEDVALNALDSFFRAVERDRFPQLHNRNDLWQILVMLTLRKTYGLIRRERRRVPLADGPGIAEILQKAGDREPTPDEAVEFAEECERLLDLLNNSKLRQVALWKLEGLTNEEIAEKLKCVPRTVERKLQTIRETWQKECRA
jgi:DNA-directed RNA polymerase specialized sigma24 family protein